MLLAPQNLDAAYWFSASTDLLATVFVLGSLIAIVRGRLSLAAALGARRVSVKGVGLRVAAAGSAGAARPAVAEAPGGDRASAGAARRGPGGAGPRPARVGRGGRRARRPRGEAIPDRERARPRVHGRRGHARGAGVRRGHGARRARRVRGDPAAEGRRRRRLAAARVLRARGGASARRGLGGRRALLLPAGGRAGLGGGGGARVRRDRGARRDRLRSS